jgi:peptidoglycan/LPS O-acetylase OafA/YrhL
MKRACETVGRKENAEKPPALVVGGNPNGKSRLSSFLRYLHCADSLRAGDGLLLPSEPGRGFSNSRATASRFQGARYWPGLGRWSAILRRICNLSRPNYLPMSAVATERDSTRYIQLDGLRGVAALMVVFSHITVAFRPEMYFGIEKGSTPNLQNWFATSPFFLSVNGSFAVYIFFVLSGFVISASADRTRSSLPATAVARFIRLSLPCAASLIFAGALFHLRLSSATTAADLVGHWWIKQLVGFDQPAPWSGVLKDALGWYYVTGLSSVNGVIWTMRRELLGSLAIYLVFALIRRSVWRGAAEILVYCGLLYRNLEPFYYVCFVAGSMLYLARGAVARTPSWIGGAALLAGAIVGGKPFFPPPAGTFYDWPYRLALSVQGGMYIWPVGAMLAVFGVLAWRPAARVFGNRAARFMGRVSFAVYLVHFPLLVCVMTSLFVRWGHISDSAFVATVLVYLLIVYTVGYGFTILIDEPGTRLSTWLKLRPWQISSWRKNVLPDPIGKP